jgi:hypothetical protein
MANFLSIFCEFPKIRFHRWSKWEVINQGIVITRKTFQGSPIECSDSLTGNYIDQKRVCHGCGFTQMNRTETKF